MEIHPVEDRRGRRRFVELARRFRGGHPLYVPPLTGEILRLLDPARNPALRVARLGLWTATDPDGRPRGRIAALFDPRHAESLGEPAGWFGFFDADGPEATRALVDQACSWLARQGAGAALGPADPDTNHECGCLMEGHDQLPYLMMPHHPPEYGTWLEAAGLEKGKDLLAYETSVTRFPFDRIEPVARRALERAGVELLHIRRRDLPRFLDAARQIYNEAWARNWGFLPMTAEEFAFEAEGLKLLVDPDYTMLAQHRGRPAGFLLGVVDPNPALHRIQSRLFPFGVLRLPFLLRRVKRMRVMALGVLPAFRRRGIELALVHHLARRAAARGIETAEMSWVLEDNREMNSLAHRVGGTVTRRYRIFRRTLQPAALSGSG